jgi:glucosamine--fructose-6-phosphate aminotransferase (isomerizing)
LILLGINYGKGNIMNKFVTEIFSQPESIDRTLDYYLSDEGNKKLRAVRDVIENGNYRKIVFTGMGSSYFASYAASCFFNGLGIQAYAINTNELLYYHFSVIARDTLVVCLSQSGESAEIVKLIQKLPGGSRFIGVTNEEDGTLAKKAGITLLSKAGVERMTSTKTYTAIILVMCILGWFLIDGWNDEKAAKIRQLVSGTEKLLNRYKDTIGEDLAFLGDIEFLQFIGRGPSYASALQSELMFKEAAKIAASGTMGGEFKHGPMEMVKPGFKSLLFVAEGSTYNQSIRMAADISRFQGKVLIITNKDPKLTDTNIRVIVADQPDEYLFVIQSIIPVQLMVNELGLSNGTTPGDFIHGGKITVDE